MLKNIADQGMAILTFTTSPIQRIIDTSRCITHQYCNDQALALYEAIGFSQEAMLLNAYHGQLQLGVVWADQSWKNIHHFLQPNSKQGLWQFSSAAFEYISHYKTAVKYLRMGYLDKAVFYLGAAAHVIQDMCVPHHANCKLFDGHKQYESWVEKNYVDISKLKDCHIVSKNPLDTMAENAATALDFYNYVTPGAGADKYRKATEVLLPLAQQSTIWLFSHFIEQAKSLNISVAKVQNNYLKEVI